MAETSFPVTSVTLIAKIKSLAAGEDSAAWVRFWDTYQLAIRRFAIMKGGEKDADDIVMSVLAKLVNVLRSGQYTPEKGHFHSYLATMIVNEVHMFRRKDVAREIESRVSLEESVTGASDDAESNKTIADTLVAPEQSSDEDLDKDWKQAVLQSAVEHVLTKTALSARDRDVYRAYALEGQDIAKVAKKFGISRNFVSQIKVRIDKRIIAVGKSLIAGEM